MILKVAASGYLPHLPFGAIGPLGLHEAGCTLEFQLHAAQVEQFRHMVIVEDILKQKLLGSLE